jgi:hypothetical protein
MCENIQNIFHRSYPVLLLLVMYLYLCAEGGGCYSEKVVVEMEDGVLSNQNRFTVAFLRGIPIRVLCNYTNSTKTSKMR